MSSVKIEQFDFNSKNFKRKLKQFVLFQRNLFKGNPNYVPILNYEYTGLKIAGITGFLEPKHHFNRYATLKFFTAKNSEDQIIGRCVAFINPRHNEKWNDKVGFFGLFDAIERQDVADALLDAASEWLKKQGMEAIRGPQNFPVNEATPGILTEGFDSRSVIYYHYNPPYYKTVIEQAGFSPVMRYFSYETLVSQPTPEKLERISQMILKRYPITFEYLKERPFSVRKKEMLEIYNDAWHDNFGFVPFDEEEFSSILDDMKLIMDKDLFLFCYVDGEPAAFFGGVPNIDEKLVKFKDYPYLELLRALWMILTPVRTTGFRLGYLGVKRKFHKLGLPAILLWKQKIMSEKLGYKYCDIGWVLEHNVDVIRLIEMLEFKHSKTYTLYEKPLK
ncbi:MAG: hypothetical protein Kow00108_18830 [Calditrichia bacterium]